MKAGYKLNINGLAVMAILWVVELFVMRWAGL